MLFKKPISDVRRYNDDLMILWLFNNVYLIREKCFCSETKRFSELNRKITHLPYSDIRGIPHQYHYRLRCCRPATGLRRTHVHGKQVRGCLIKALGFYGEKLLGVFNMTFSITKASNIRFNNIWVNFGYFAKPNKGQIFLS